MFTKVSQKSLKLSRAATSTVSKRTFAASAKTRHYLDLDKKHVQFYFPLLPELVVDRGERVYLWDVDGNRYYDMMGGFGSVS